MESRVENLLIGEDEEFRIEIKYPLNSKIERTLYCNKERQKLRPQAILLLERLARKPGCWFTKNELLEHLGLKADAANDIIYTHVWSIRDALGDKEAKRSLESNNGEYRLSLKVRRDGFGGIDAFSTWSDKILDELISTVELDPDAEEDLRIVTTGFTGSPIDNLHLNELVKKNVRVRIVMLDPAEGPPPFEIGKLRPVMTARHRLRGLRTLAEGRPSYGDGMTLVNALAQVSAQFNLLLVAMESWSGRLQVKLSSAMPCAFVAHTAESAVAGMFLSHVSYSQGPMIRAYRGSDAWEQLHKDWKMRWYDPDAVPLEPASGGHGF